MPIEKLISIASGPLSGELPQEKQGITNARVAELRNMLSMRNGFYAFEGALHVLPWRTAAPQESVIDVQAWNGETLWRYVYQECAQGLFFFAQDAFGGQFAIRGDAVVSFDPETAEIESVAPSIEGWASEILSKYKILTGYPVAHAWQLANGEIPAGKRLLPKIPFILGGKYEEQNLVAVEAAKAMRYRGEVWQQIKDLPDGAQIKLKALPLN